MFSLLFIVVLLFRWALVVSCFYLHEHFDVLVLPQEISAQRHPLWHQVQDFAFPLRRLPPVLFGSAALGAVGGEGGRLRLFPFFPHLAGGDVRFADIRQSESKSMFVCVCVRRRRPQSSCVSVYAIEVWALSRRRLLRMSVRSNNVSSVWKDIVPAELDINRWWTWTLGRSAGSHPGVCLQERR